MSDYTDFKQFTDYQIFDADQHLYESADCYTRHIAQKYADRTIRLERDGDGKLIGFAQERRLMQDNDLSKCYRPAPSRRCSSR